MSWLTRVYAFSAKDEIVTRQVARNLGEGGKTLVAGWFSFTDGHATAGDLMARDLACEWLDVAGVPYDVALAPPFGNNELGKIEPQSYSQVVFVCGPFEQGELEALLFSRFGHCNFIGLNLSMAVPLEKWNPFHLLLERDSSRRARADIVFMSPRVSVPVVGVCLVEPHEGAIDQIANDAVARLTSSREMAVVSIDTRLDHNATGLRSAREIEALIARMDVLITTRLHGTVLALKNGVPVIAIDPIPGGAKIRRQVETIGWPIVFNADAVTDGELQQALSYCLTDAARSKARRCAAGAVKAVETIRDAFITAVSLPGGLRSASGCITIPESRDWLKRFVQENADPVEPSFNESKEPLKKRMEAFVKRLTRCHG